MPITIKYNDERYYFTGKTSTHPYTDEPGHQYQSEDERSVIWVYESGEIIEV